MRNTISYCYDALNRVTGKKYGGGANCSNSQSLDVRYGYDVADRKMGDPDYYPVGRRTTMDDATGHTAWNYDQRGRITDVQRWIQPEAGSQAAPVTYKIRYDYNPDNTLSRITYPSGRVVGYEYDGTGRNTQVWKHDFESGQTLFYASSAHYTAGGALANVLLGNAASCFNGIQGAFSYNNRLQPNQVLYTHDLSANAAASIGTIGCAAGDKDVLHRQYQFENNGNVSKIVNCTDNGRSQNFTYDNLNRIATATTDGGTWGDSFDIDAWGNLRSIGGVAGMENQEFLELGAVNNRNQFFSQPYDATGNLLSSNGHWFNYDAENRIAAVDREVSYGYDGDGQRVIKDLGGYGTLYWSGPDGQLLAETDLSGHITSEYVYFNGKRLARIDNPTDPAAAQLRYYFSDHLGSTSMVMDETFATVLEDNDYTPFGAIAYQGGEGDWNHFFFTGKERDQETGLDYFGARYLASNMGRWMNPDPTLLSVNALNPQSWNRYAYVLNNPLKFVDPLGLWELLATDQDKVDKKGKHHHHISVTAKHSQKGDNGTTLAKQLGLKGKEAANFAAKVGDGNNVRLSKEGGRVGSVFAAVENDLTQQANDGAIKGPDCSLTSANIGFDEHNSRMGTANLDVLLSERASPESASDARVGDIIRFGNAENTPVHFVNFIFADDSGTPMVFSKGGVGGPYEVRYAGSLEGVQRGGVNYGNIQGVNNNESGYYRPQ